MSVTFLRWLTFSLPKPTSHAYWETMVLVWLTYSSCKCVLTRNLVLTEQVAGGIVVPGSGRLIACLGVDDLVIVDMPDTLLVTTRARSQEVKRLVKKCGEAGWKQLL